MHRIKLELINTKKRPYLKFIFGTYLDKLNAERTVLKWESIFSSLKNEKIDLIWDCKKMEDYDPVARRILQKALNELKAEIGRVWVITDQQIIKSSVILIARSTSLDIKIVDSEEDITI